MIPSFTVSRDDAIYESFPDVTLTESGDLLCVFSESTHHADRSYSCNVITRSGDRGRTWTDKSRLTDPLYRKTDTDSFWDCPRVSTPADGTVLAVVNRIQGSIGGDHATEENFLLVSEDEGRTWSELIGTPITGIVPDQVTQLSQGEQAGRWITATHSVSDEGLFAVRAWTSDDSGDSWNGPTTIAAESDLDLCEASIAEMPGGELVCFMRENSGEGLDAYKSISRDAGETWDGPYRMPIPGCHRPVAGVLDDGNVLITYRFMQGGSGWLGSWTQNTFAALTDVESCLAEERNAAQTRILPLDYDRNPNADTGYTGWIQFDDGEIYIVNYIVDNSPQTRVREPPDYTGEYADQSKAFIRGYAIDVDSFITDPELLST